MNKNMILAIVLSVIVMYIWGEFFAPKPAPQTAAKKTETVTSDSKQEKTQKLPTPESPTQMATPSGSLVPSIKNPEQKERIYNDYLLVEVSTEKGRIDAITITDEKYKNKKLNLLSGLKKDAYFPQLSSVFNAEPTYKLLKKTKNSVTFSYEQDNIIELKTIMLTDNYIINVSKKVINKGTNPVVFKPFFSFYSQFQNEDIFNSYRKQFEIYTYLEQGGFENNSDQDDLRETFKLVENDTIIWAGINYGFFLMAAINETGKIDQFEGTINDDANLSHLTVHKPAISIANGEEAFSSYKIYFGPKELKKLEEAGHHLDESVSFGVFFFLAKPLLAVLNFIYDFLGNYGLAIILLTFMIKILLWPLSTASFKSMNKMKKLTPKINALKEKYKDDKETLNRETMLMYQKEGVNPLGGCLPMFIQMPVYFALYTMLNNAVELYNAPFLPFWLTDLSAKDPYFILPLMLGGFMFLQQKMMPQQMDNQQAKVMMYTMPVVFTVMMVWLQSGLVLYILVNTLLGIAQQVYINKKYA